MIQDLIESGQYSNQNMATIAGMLDPLMSNITPELMEMVLGETSDSYDLDNAQQDLFDIIMEGLTGESEGLFTDDEMSAQAQALKKEADAAKQKLAMQMAMRGMGASGLAGAGFGNIDSKLVDAINQLAITSKAQGAELDLNKAGTAASLLSSLQSDETRRYLAEMAFDYQKEQDALANAEVWQNNALAKVGADRFSAGEAGKISRMLAAGVPWYEIEENLGISQQGDESVAFLDLEDSQIDALIEKYADGSGQLEGELSSGGRIITTPAGDFYVTEDGELINTDNLNDLMATEDYVVMGLMEAAGLKYAQATGDAAGGKVSEFWDLITNKSGQNERPDSERVKALAFVAEEFGYSFPPPGSQIDGWSTMPASMRKDYWVAWQSKGEAWKPNAMTDEQYRAEQKAFYAAAIARAKFEGKPMPPVPPGLFTADEMTQIEAEAQEGGDPDGGVYEPDDPGYYEPGYYET